MLTGTTKCSSVADNSGRDHREFRNAQTTMVSVLSKRTSGGMNS